MSNVVVSAVVVLVLAVSAASAGERHHRSFLERPMYFTARDAIALDALDRLRAAATRELLMAPLRARANALSG